MSNPEEIDNKSIRAARTFECWARDVKTLNELTSFETWLIDSEGARATTLGWKIICMMRAGLKGIRENETEKI